MEERRNGERGSGSDISGLGATVPGAAAGSVLGERHCSPANGSSLKLGRARGLEHPGGRLEKGSREREIWSRILEGCI